MTDGKERTKMRLAALLLCASLAAGTSRAEDAAKGRAANPAPAQADSPQPTAATPPEAAKPKDNPAAQTVPVEKVSSVKTPEPLPEVPLATRPVPADPYVQFCTGVYQSANAGARWLLSSQRADGLFTYGWIPALNRPLAGNNYLRQAGAAAALARSAAMLQDAELMLGARHAILMLLESYTEPDPADANRRRPKLSAANPVGFSALLLLAISELPEPGQPLIEQGEQLARFLASRQRPDGSLNISASFDDDGADVPDGVHYYPGEALYALMRSFANRPDQWKIDVVTKAFDYYHRCFKEQPSVAFVPWQTGAYVEAYRLTGEARFAQFVFEMNDWLLQLQYSDPRRVDPSWIGGIAEFADGQTIPAPPGATTASFAEAMVDACRAARIAGDSKRHTHYKTAAEQAFRFLMANQYTPTGYPHFEHWFVRRIAGAFHGSVEDGTIRIDYTQHAVNGMFHYLSHVAEFKQPKSTPDVPLQLKAN